MDDPTKDTIPRSAVEYCLRKETVSTNPEKYKTHEKFIDYMNDPDISEFGHWMHSNGFNCALTAISVDLKKIPSVTPSAQPGCEDAVPRTSIEYICKKNTVSTNPYEHKYHDKFIQFMDDPEISDFGRWQHSNGFNTALVAVKCDLDKVPSVTPKAYCPEG